MEPNKREIESRNVASMMLYVQRKRGKKIHYVYGEDELRSISSSLYGDPGAVDGLTADLCETLRELEKSEPETFDQIVYNAKDAQSRKLADWWERHQAFDEQRIAREKREQEEQYAKDYAEYLRLKERFEK
jgi:hypothetical protein